MKIEVLGHAAVKLSGEKVIYVDPFHIDEDYHDADYIFITHDHFDHYDKESIDKVKKEDTKLIVPSCLKEKENNLVVEPNKKYELDGLKFETVKSYNIGKEFHPKEKDYVGYNICLEDEFFYIMGDTDRTPETEMVKTNYCFVPIGGTYTMNADEAANYINFLKPKVAIPIHYGQVTGSDEDAKEFQEKVDKNIKVEIKI